MSYKVFFEDQSWLGRARLWVYQSNPYQHGGPPTGYLVAKLVPIDEEKIAGDEHAFLSENRGDGATRDFLQAALDCAWELGMRPAGFKGYAGELAALKDHLHDMRALVYGDSSTLSTEAKTPPPLYRDIPSKK